MKAAEPVPLPERRNRLLNYLRNKRGIDMAKKAGASPAVLVRSAKLTPAHFFDLCCTIKDRADSLRGCNKSIGESASELTDDLGFEVSIVAIRKAQKATGVVWAVKIGPKRRLQQLDEQAKAMGFASIEAALAKLAALEVRGDRP